MSRRGARRPRPLGATDGRVDALVTEGQSRTALAGVRALAAAGLRPLVMAPGRGAAGKWSRHAAARASGPAPEDPGFVARIGELAVEYGPLVVHPAQEDTLAPLIDGLDGLPPEAIVPYAGAEGLRLLSDKAALAPLAEQAGLAAPTTLAQGPAGTVAADPPAAPCVVKSVRGKGGALPYTRMVDTDAELGELLASLPADEEVIVQERAGGPLVGLAVVLDREGRTVARFQQVARRLWPLQAGGSSVAMSVAPDPELSERTAALLRAAGYWGLAQVQFLTTPRGPALIDVNPRYYGSMPLATAAGVNLPAAWQAVALGERLPEAPPYRAGVTYRWLEADLRAALKGSRGHLRPVRPRPSAGTQWAADDPLPAALLVGQTAGAMVGRRLRRRASP